LTFAELNTELVSRGATADPTRNGRWLNLAYREIGNAYDWPFTEASATGSAGTGVVAVADFRKAIVVGNILPTGGTLPGDRLHKITYAELTEDLGVDSISQAGTPEFWWYDPSVTQIKAYPLGGTVYARYYKRLSELSGAQTPAFDAEYHNLIVDRAMMEVYKDTPEFELVNALEQSYLGRLGRMASDYQVTSREHGYIQVVDPRDG
jgi:hypothetical protein